jgi:hypothetical protein
LDTAVGLYHSHTFARRAVRDCRADRRRRSAWHSQGCAALCAGDPCWIAAAAPWQRTGHIDQRAPPTRATLASSIHHMPGRCFPRPLPERRSARRRVRFDQSVGNAGAPVW